MTALFLFVAAVYVLSAAGYLDTIDADPSLDAAKALLDRGSFRFFPDRIDSRIHTRAKDNGCFSKLGLAMPFLYIPAVILGRGAAKLLGRKAETIVRFLVSLVNSILTAANIALLYFFFLETGSSPEVARAIALTTAFATLLFPYAKTDHREALQGLSLTGTLVFAALGLQIAEGHYFFLSGLSAGIGLLTKLAMIVPLLPAIGFASFLCARVSVALLPYLLLPIGIAGMAWLIFAKNAYGSFFETGYSEGVNRLRGPVWPTPFFRGLHIQLFSLESGLFFYSPILLIPVRAFIEKMWYGNLSALDMVIFLVFILRAALYARWKTPNGHECLGPRYLVATIPLLAMLLNGAPLPATVVWLPLLAWSAVLQVVHVAVKAQQYCTMREFSPGERGLPHWIANLKIFAHKLAGKEECYRLRDFGFSCDTKIDLSPYRSLIGFNIWWMHGLRACWDSLRHQRRRKKG